MNQLTLVQTNSGLFAASRQVAEMIDVRHADLIRSIAGYIHILENAKLRYQDFFEADSYKVSGNNKNYTRYLPTHSQRMRHGSEQNDRRARRTVHGWMCKVLKIKGVD